AQRPSRHVVADHHARQLDLGLDLLPRRRAIPRAVAAGEALGDDAFGGERKSRRRPMRAHGACPAPFRFRNKVSGEKLNKAPTTLRFRTSRRSRRGYPNTQTDTDNMFVEVLACDSVHRQWKGTPIFRFGNTDLV